MKTGYEILALPITNVLVKWVKKRKEVDVFDRGISYNPLKLKICKYLQFIQRTFINQPEKAFSGWFFVPKKELLFDKFQTNFYVFW